MSELLRKRLEEKEKMKEKDSTFWSPEEGEILEGKVAKIGTTITEYGDADFAEIELEGGVKKTVFINPILARQFEEEEVREGDEVAVKFLGKVQSKKTKRWTKNYVVAKAAV